MGKEGTARVKTSRSLRVAVTGGGGAARGKPMVASAHWHTRLPETMRASKRLAMVYDE